MAQGPLVVGIDLSASPQNPTTLAVLEGRAFRSLRRLGTNEEIAAALAALDPDVAAVDAPLTAPRGVVGGYAQRAAEAAVRAAGIPILAPSFIATLTFRGMDLARRRLPAPLVETYPHGIFTRLGHAALGRKQTAEEGTRRHAFLSRHVASLPDAFADDHEADAVACALAAALHAEDGLEPFGDPEEGQIWLPRASLAPP